MIRRQSALILLSTLSLIQTAEVAEQISLTVVEPGGSLNLTCPFFGNEAGLFYWYKLKFGYMVQTVAVGTFRTVNLQAPFDNSRFTVTKVNSQYVLNIRNVSKEDEATYFCQAGSAYIMKFINVTLLVVNDHKNQKKSFYVKQNPEAEWVEQGERVTLKCSLLSTNKETSDQCPGEHSVYWFRSRSGESNPSIIYTQSDEQEERSCFHSLSKTIQTSSDTGTYYCAVLTCGEILFGEGTKVETKNQLCPYLVVLGILLGCSVTVIVALIIFRNRKPVCENQRGGASIHDGSADDQASNVDDEAVAMNYVALDFPSRNAKRWTNTREFQQNCLYSGTRDKKPTSLMLIDSVKMILLWVALLVLHRGYTLVPVTTVQLGEPVTLMCDLPDEFRDKLYWYKQSAGETLKLIVRLQKHANPVYGPQFSASRLDVNISNKISRLTILRTIQKDEGMYHCAVMEWTEITWSGTYLSLKGNTQRTSNYAVVQWPTVSDPVPPEASMSLQCSVLSDSKNKMCPGDHSVFWFRAGSDKSHPDIIYTDGNRHEECDRNSDTQKSCVYRFSKNVSSSDAGTYYCAVATCGQILFGDGTKVEIERTRSFEFTALVIVTICLVISLTGNIVFICYRNRRPACPQFRGVESGALQGRHDNWSQPVHDITEGGPDMNYAALQFSGNKATRGRKKKELKTEESVYSQVKCSM
ncbi:uncharacterized protein LOC126389035 [Epinephelus moara]|uniref:uncharacterized protein LOC126389035 n=1 Tax=Epinephelus moara TaxID=300413 RepID=UPI00214E02D0|nr:uncharacterized protein LOC126389035 [Epinephelus moara]